MATFDEEFTVELPTLRTLLREAVKPTAPFPTDVASMRTYLAESFDRLLGLPRLLLGADDRRIVYASQAHWQAAPDAEVLDLLNRIPPG